MPGTLAPMYQEFALGNIVISPKSFTCCTQPATAPSVGSIDSKPSVRRRTRVSAIQLVCCSIDTTMFESTEGLPGPVTMNRFGKPAAIKPR